MKKVAWLVTHPIQYYSPMYRYISKNCNLGLTVFYFSDFSIREHKDEEFGISGGLEYKNLGEIISDISDMGNQAADIASSFSGTAGAIVGFGKSVMNSGSNIKKISSGFRDEATPWMGFQKAIAHTHGNITLNFIITRQLKDAKELLNKMSMQEISSRNV